jgi:hypothetical protein
MKETETVWEKLEQSGRNWISLEETGTSSKKLKVWKILEESWRNWNSLKETG